MHSVKINKIKFLNENSIPTKNMHRRKIIRDSWRIFSPVRRTFAEAFRDGPFVSECSQK